MAIFHRSINVIAADIEKDWRNVNYAARPYLSAMFSLSDINGRYGMDSAENVIRYFLSNASTWRGDKARAIKAELKGMINGAQ